MPLLARVTIGCTLVVGAAAGGVAGGGSLGSVGVGEKLIGSGDSVGGEEKLIGSGDEIEMGVITVLGCGEVGGVECVETGVLTIGRGLC